MFRIKSFKKKFRGFWLGILIGSFSVLFTVIFYVLYINFSFAEKVYPGIWVNEVNLSGLKRDEAVLLLSEKIKTPSDISIETKDQNFKIPLKEIDFYYDFQKTASSAFQYYRDGSLISKLITPLLSPFKRMQLSPSINFNEQKLDDFLSVIAGQIAVEPIPPSISVANDRIIINRGSQGENIDIKKLKADINQFLTSPSHVGLTVSLVPIDETLSVEEEIELKNRAQKLLGKSLQLQFEYQNFNIKDKEIIPLLPIPGVANDTNIDALVHNIEKGVNRESQNSVFVFRDEKVEEFKASEDGIKVETDKLKSLIINSLSILAATDEKYLTAEIPVIRTKPQITTADVNNLGIKELVGRGSSRFSGSIPSRIHNVGLASSKFNGTLVPPGSTFSFNEALGDVSSYTGYKQAYIIQDGKTVLGDGGGVCQVSTTLFRAVLNAGLEVVERRAHSYRVAYYEQGSPAGLDATVFAPTTDFKFKNDTPGHILIQSVFDAKKQTLVFELYGTRDGRVATVTKPVVTGIVPPPEDLYIDDQSLKMGVIKQIDFKAWGAKVSFDYRVEKEGKTLFEKKFLSNYRPWQAKFMRGTGEF